jgi:hypothetical protein
MRIRALSLAGTLALVAACATPPLIAPREWNATLQTRGEGQARATVRAVSGGATTAVAINLAGGEPAGTHPWHIHSGTCATGGPIVGDADRYPPLRPTGAGTAASTATVNAVLVPEQQYHVNVHRSPAALNQVIACGDLQ